jgi:serine phosphatase RsbU (regulator of sigma subunit)
MDIAITVIDTEKQQFQFASAMRPVYHVHKGELKEIKGSRYPIGGRNPGFTKYFPSITVNYASGDRLFLCSDGYADQFGGPFEKKFMTRQLKRLLQDLASCDMQEAEKRLVQGFNDWKGRHPQTDDLLMIGLHL